MPESDDERIADLEATLWHDDPRFARALGKGRPRRPRERRSRVIPGLVLPHPGPLASERAGSISGRPVREPSITRHVMNRDRPMFSAGVPGSERV
ncbi:MULTISPECIES: DUF3040 domain-containing protein [unclassified Streptomyces]|uniref:DUF3040 domain-containing protein n=1 Tax=unclassified Streptomyces TaxID=2593676 RepID=UPI000DC7D3BC|nr:hypothetical protein DRB89_07195 [Streptomyces sp. ICC4]AWZ12107.1 hypothetical protein DRB96_06990 [Streptomyces sp. ICC1]